MQQVPLLGRRGKFLTQLFDVLNFRVEIPNGVGLKPFGVLCRLDGVVYCFFDRFLQQPRRLPEPAVDLAADFRVGFVDRRAGPRAQAGEVGSTVPQAPLQQVPGDAKGSATPIEAAAEAAWVEISPVVPTALVRFCHIIVPM